MRLTRIRAKVKKIFRSRFVSGQQGQTLAEVLVALLILGIAGVGLLSGLTWSYAAANLNNQRTTAESLTRTELERIRYASYPISDSSTSKLDGRFQVLVQADYVIPTINDTVEPYTTDYVVTTDPQTMQLVTVTILNDIGKTLLVTNTVKVSR